MSIILDEAQAYENSRDYDCCQIIEGAYTVGDAIYEAYCAGREAPPTDTEITAAAKYLKANPGLFGPSACFIDPNRFGEIARGVLQAARTAMQVHLMSLSHYLVINIDSSHRRLPASEMLWVMNGRRIF